MPATVAVTVIEAMLFDAIRKKIPKNKRQPRKKTEVLLLVLHFRLPI
jgi:hypothetical protein